MDKIKTVKIKEEDGSVSQESYYISTDARCVDMANGYDLQETIGTIDIDTDGNIAEQLKKKAYYFDTVADMKNANLQIGDYAVTLGYYSVNDGGAAKYKIVNNTDNYKEDLKNGFFSELIIENKINIHQLGARGDGVSDDSDVILKALQLAFKNKKTKSNSNLDTNMIIEFLDRYYYLKKIVEFNEYLNSVVFEGNKAIIIGHGFHFGAKPCHTMIVNKLNFENVDTCFEFDYIDRNYQTMVFRDCIYRECNNVFKIYRRSVNILFENCTFRASGKAMYLYNCDKVEINNCWFQQKIETVADYSCFIEQTGNDEGWIDVHDCMFIPQWTGNNISWFKINKKITAHHNRFSGEVPNETSIIYTSNDMDTEDASGQRYVVDFHDNPIVDSKQIIILNGIPELLSIRNNGGRKNGGKIIIWDPILTENQQKIKLENKLSSFHLVFSGNGFRNFDLLSGYINLPSVLLPSIPKNLCPFIQKKYRSQDYQAQYMIESHIMDGTATNELRIKLCDLSNYQKINNLGLTFLLAYRANSSGLFDAENMIDIITLNQDTSNSILKISKQTLLGNRSGDYTITFSNGATSIDTSITSNPIIVITKASGKVLNYVQFIPLQLEDILTLGQL